jgi:hypothetical protein
MTAGKPLTAPCFDIPIDQRNRKSNNEINEIERKREKEREERERIYKFVCVPHALQQKAISIVQMRSGPCLCMANRDLMDAPSDIARSKMHQKPISSRLAF